MKYHLEFDCGARLPESGQTEGSYAERCKKDNLGHQRKKDGRYRILVYGPSATTPVMPDGKKALCRFNCPCKRSSGRREERGFLEGETPSFRGGHCFITCYPKEFLFEDSK